MDKMIEKLAVFSEKLSQSMLIRVIMGSFAMIMPVSLIGSIASLLNGMTIPAWQTFLASSGVGTVLSAVYQWTVGNIGLYLSFFVAMTFLNQCDMKKAAVPGGLISMVSFLITTPYTAGTLPTDWLGATGMFSAIIVGFITGLLFKLCTEKNIVIKMPSQVPPMVANQFTAMIPGAVTVVVFGLISWIFARTSFGSFHSLIYTILAMPIRNLGANIWGWFILSIFCSLLWFFGIHGGMIVVNILIMVFMPLQMENLAAYQAGLPLPNMVVGTALSCGTGSLVMLIAVFLVAKSKTARSIGKIAVIPALFGVDEPAYFGMPMIMNPIFFIPWVIITPVTNIFVTYLLNLTGLLPYATGASIGFNLPPFVLNFVSFGWKGVFWGFVLMAIQVAGYIPFVRAYDKQLLKKEAEETDED